MKEPNTTQEEEHLDDLFLEEIDPYAMSKWDKVEGEKEREEVIQALRKRISSRHHYSLYSSRDDEVACPNYGIDDHLTDQCQIEGQNEWDEALYRCCLAIEDYKHIFARTPKNPGVTDSIEHTIETSGPLPQSAPMYRRSLPDRNLIKEWVMWMLENGLIERSSSKCAQNVLIVKKEGKDPRVCLDPRPINKMTNPDSYPMPRMDEIFAGLHGSLVFSALDAASGFWQVPLAEKDRHKAAFRCELGVFQFRVMPFGLNNAPATFTRWMTTTMEGLNNFLKIYIDDLLVHSQKVSDHPNQLREVFQRCETHNVKLRLSKCTFMQEELPMLGFIINKQGVKKDMKKIQALLEWGEGRSNGLISPFKNLQSLQSFLGLVNFFKHHHHFIAHELKWLNDLLKKEKHPRKDWTLQHEQAFQRVKEVLAEQSLLFYPDETALFELHTDASKYAIGGTLLQIRLIGPEKIPHVIEFYSRALRAAELNYSVTEKEFLAIVVCIEKWHHYLHKPFLVVTDHQPLLGIKHTNKPRLKRWMLRITPYTFDIEHRPGVDMAVADPLSRDPRLFRIAMEEEATQASASEEVFQEYESLYKSASVEIHASPMVIAHLTYLGVRVFEDEVSEEIVKTLNLKDDEHEHIPSESSPGSPVQTSLTLVVPETKEEIVLSMSATIREQSEQRYEAESKSGPVTVEIAGKDIPPNPLVPTHPSGGQEVDMDSKYADSPTAKAERSAAHDTPIPGEVLDQTTDSEQTKSSQTRQTSSSILDRLLGAIEGIDPAVLHPATKTFADEQRQDPKLKDIIDQLGKAGDAYQGPYFVEKDTKLLLRKDKGKCPLIVVPDHAIPTLLYLYHDHQLAGHAKKKKMYAAMKTRYYFPSMNKRIEAWVKQCKCRKASARLHKRAGYTLSRPIPRLFEFLVMDIVGPFPTSRSQNKYWLTLICALSKDVELVAIKDRSAIQVAKAILERWVCRRGCPSVVLSDNAKEFVGEVIGHLCDSLAIRHDLITPYHHEGTGLVEKVHDYAESIMQALMEEKPTNSAWDTTLPFIQFAILTHEIDDSGVSPFQVKHGVPATLPGDLLNNSLSLPNKLRQYYKHAQQAMQATRDYFSIERRKKRVKTQLQRNRLDRRYRQFYNPGDAVYVIKPSFYKKEGLKAVKKIQGRERGPFQVISRDAYNNILVDVDGEHMKFNIQQVEPAPTLIPVVRKPPTYKGGSLIYQPEIEEEAGQRPTTPKAPQSRTRAQKSQKASAKARNEEKKAKKALSSPRSKTEGRNSHHKQFSIVRDTVMGQNYACELLQESPEQEASEVHLYAKAKKGTFQPIWFDPEDLADPPRSKAAPSQPKDWKPWIQPLDDSWKLLLVNTEGKLSDLKRHKLL